MATPALDSHQTSTSDEQTVKLSSEAVKVTEQINVSSPQEAIEDDREKGKADNLHILDSTLSTSDEKAVDIQFEPPVIEVKKTDEAPVVELPVHDKEKLGKESTFVAEVATVVADETVHEESTSTEPVGEETIELPVIAFLEKNIKEFDATVNVKSPPEVQPTAEVIERKALEVPQAASAQNVEEQPSEAVGLTRSEDKSSGDTVDSQEKERPGADVQFVTEVAEKVEIVSTPAEKVEEKKPIKEFDETDYVKSPPEEQPTAKVIEREALEILSEPVEEVEEKKPKIIDNPESPVVADSGKDPAEAEEEPVTECVSVEKELDKEPESDVLEESVEPTKKKAQPIEVVPVEVPIKVVAKEIIETVEPPPETEQPVEVHPIKELEEVIAKEIREHIEVPEEKASEDEPVQESREVIETKISEPVEVPQKSELPVEVHPANELVIEKETNESIEPLKNEEHSEEVISHIKSVEVIGKEVRDSFEPRKNKEEAGEGFSVTESGEVKEKGTSDFTLGSKEAENQREEVIEVKNGIEELPEITKHVQDTYVEAELVKDEKPLTPRDDTGPPSEIKIQKEEGSDKQESVHQVAESGPIEDSVKGLEESEQPAAEVVSVESEPKKEPGSIEAVASKELAEVVAKEVIETFEPPTDKEQLVEKKEVHEVVTKEVIETVEPPIEKKQPVAITKEITEAVTEKDNKIVEPSTENQQPALIAKEVSDVAAVNKQPALMAKEVSEMVAEEVTETIEPPTESEQPVVIAKEISDRVAEEVTETVEPPTENDQSVVIAKEVSKVVAEEVTETIQPPTEKEQSVMIAKEISEVIAKKVEETVEPPTEKEQLVVKTKEISEEIAKEVTETIEPPTENEQPVVIEKEVSEEIAKEVTETVESGSTEKEQPMVIEKEISEVIAKEVTETVEPPTEKEQPVMIAKEISELITKQVAETVEPPAQKEQIVVITKDTSESIEPLKNEKQPDEVISHNESVEVIAPEVNASFDPPKNNEQAEEDFPVAEPSKKLEVEGLAKEFVSVNSEPREELETSPVQDLSVEPPKKEEQTIEVHTVKEQVEVINREIIDRTEIRREMEQIDVPTVRESMEVATEKVSESVNELLTEFSVDSLKKEEPVEVIPAVKVIEKEILEGFELLTEKEQPIGVHSQQGSYNVVEKDISEPIELPMEKEQIIEVQPVQESKEAIAEKINESLEIPKEGGLLIEEVQPLKELEVVAQETIESIEAPKYKDQLNEVPLVKESVGIAKEISGPSIPSNDTKQTDEGFFVTESKGGGEKETSGSKLNPKEVEKRELEVTEVKDGKKELPEITNLVCNDYVKVETEAVENGGTTKGEKSLALGDESTPPMGLEQTHKEEQCTLESDKQDSLDHEKQPPVELVKVDISPQVLKEDERKESSNIEEVSKLSEVESLVVVKLGEENEEKFVKSEKADEDEHEKKQESTLPREEVAPRDFETDVVVVEKSTDDQNAGEVADLIAETKTEEGIKDEKPAEVELEVKDKEVGIKGGEVPKVNDKKVPSKQSHKHSHNLLSKVKQSLVKAKKAIIGKSPSSKTLSSEPKDDIKVK